MAGVQVQVQVVAWAQAPIQRRGQPREPKLVPMETLPESGRVLSFLTVEVGIYQQLDDMFDFPEHSMLPCSPGPQSGSVVTEMRVDFIVARWKYWTG